MRYLVLLSLLLVSALGYAAPILNHGMGNGGDAVVCYTNANRSEITSVRMFDYWEQEQVLHYGPVEMGTRQLSVQEKIEIVVQRINTFDPALGQRIGFIARNLADNIQRYLVTSYELPEIDDATPQAVPSEPNCYIEQYAVQYKDLITGQRRFSIAAKFYNHVNTSNDDRAGIILHEAIYRYAIERNPSLSSSDDVRYLNYVFSSLFLDTLKTYDIEKFHNILVKAQIQQSDCALKNGVYLKSLFYDEQLSCYNQWITLDSNISVKLTQGTHILDYAMVPDEDNPRARSRFPGISLEQREAILPFSVELKHKGQIKKFLARDFYMTKEHLLLNPEGVGGAFVQMIKGPSGKSFECAHMLKFDSRHLDLISCLVKEEKVVANSQTYILSGYMRQLNGNRWIIDPTGNGIDGKFNLLGSKKPFSLNFSYQQRDDANTQCKTREITVDSNLNVVAGCFRYGNLMEVDGLEVRLVNSFEVQEINGEYLLRGQMAHSRDAKGIYSPVYKNLRLIKTSEEEKFNYCGTLPFPSKRTWVFAQTEEYIGYPGESFYDLSTDAVVYKSDERVSILSRVGCPASDFISKDY